MQLTVIAALTLIFSLLILSLKGEQPTIASVATIFGAVVSAVYAAVLIFVHWAWPWGGFRGWLVKRPDLRGSWKANLYSDWIDPDTNEKAGVIEAFVIVRQTLTSLSMRLFTDKSRSVLIAHSIEPEPDGLFSLSAVYRNSPQIEYQGKQSAMHHGALLIEVHEVRPRRLEGHYWTDRGTRGSIFMEHKNKSVYSSFDDAKQALAGEHS